MAAACSKRYPRTFIPSSRWRVVDATRFVPLSRKDILTHGAADADLRRVANLLHHNMRHDADAAAEAVRQTYGPFDPDPLFPVGSGQSKAFLLAFGQLMEDANFRRVTSDEIQEAFAERSLFPLAVSVDLDEYDILRMYRRGVGHRTERYRGLRTLYRWKAQEVELYERLVVVLRLKEEVLAGDRTARMDGMEAGKIYLKSFKNIPTSDVEMVLPNTRLRLRTIDRFMVGGPLVAGLGATLFNSISIFLAILAGAFALSFDDPQVRALGGVLLVLGGYLWKTHSKIKNTRLRYLRMLSSGLYFRNLANNAAVIDQALGFGQREEEKEALLAYLILQNGPATRKHLDNAAQAWLLDKTGRSVDFDVADALDSLKTLRLATRRLGRWSALPPTEAAYVLAARWDALL